MKTKALISFAVTAKLICAFVFTIADCLFSHEEAQIILKVPFGVEGLGVWWLYGKTLDSESTELGPVVQNLVSLTSSLRPQLVKSMPTT